jgi:hypothetical protein
MDALGAPGDMQGLGLKMLMDRRAQTLQLLSNLLKTASDTAAAITANLK